MQVRKIFLFLLSCSGLLCFTTLQAQNVVMNEKGEKIVVYPDGSWRYYEENMNLDSVQLSPTAQSIQLEKEQMEDEIKRGKKSKKEKDNQVVNGMDDQLLKQAMEQEKIAGDKVYQIEEQIKDVSFNRIFLEKELEDAHAMGEATLDDLLLIEQRLKAARNAENKVKESLSDAKKEQKMWSRIIEMPPSKRKKAMKNFVQTPASQESQPNSPFSILSNEEEPNLSDEETETNSNTSTAYQPVRSNRKLKEYNKSEDVLYNPPKIKSCEFTFDGVDEFSGKKRRELAPQLFFTYTSDQLRPYFKDREYITCMAHLTAVSGGLKYLTMEFTIASPNAQREFGLLEKGSPVNLKFLDGSTIKLINTKTDMGQLDPVKKTVIYKAQFTVSSGAEKILRKNEIDLVRVVWSQGYEDYEVYYMDFIADQFECFE